MFIRGLKRPISGIAQRIILVAVFVMGQSTGLFSLWLYSELRIYISTLNKYIVAQPLAAGTVNRCAVSRPTCKR